MLKTAEILEKLKSIGFKENESKVLFVLMRGEAMSASDIAKESGIIRNSIYDTLKSFVESGYCNEIETNTILKYKSIDPLVIIDKIEKSLKDSYTQKVGDLNKVFSDIKEHYSSKKKVSADESQEHNIELIRGYNKHRMEKFVEIFRHAKKSVYGMYRLSGIVSEELDDIAAKFLKRGGELRSVYFVNLNFKIIKNGAAEPATADDLIRVCEKFEKAGEQIRLSSLEVPNMVIFDEEIVFNNISDKDIPRHQQADIIIKNENNAKRMIDLFNYYWENGITIEEYKKSVINISELKQAK
jgi:sugar-specific transcriptional regulator TrmB